MPSMIMKRIMAHLETLLNGSIDRTGKLHIKDNHFKFDGFMASESFIRAPSGHFIENFQLVFAHRKKSSTVYLSANPRRVMAAVYQGVTSVPVVPYLAYFTNDN